MLSAKELVDLSKETKDQQLPSFGEKKQELYSLNKDADDVQLKVIYNAYEKVLSEPRIDKLHRLVEGKWNAAEGLVEIEKTGRFWQTFGHTVNGKLVLYPEEALFLVETNKLVIKDGTTDMFWSIEDAYCKLIQCMTLSVYRVYAYLCRQGYTLLRHKDFDVSKYEKKIKLYKYIRYGKRKSKSHCGRDKSALDEEESVEADIVGNTINIRSSVSNQPKGEDDKSGNVGASNNSPLTRVTHSVQEGSARSVQSTVGNCSTMEVDCDRFSCNRQEVVTDIDTLPEPCNASSESKVASKCCSTSNSSHWNHTNIKFPHWTPGHADILMAVPDAKYLPPNVPISQLKPVLDFEHFKQTSQVRHQLKAEVTKECSAHRKLGPSSHENCATAYRSWYKPFAVNRPVKIEVRSTDSGRSYSANNLRCNTRTASAALCWHGLKREAALWHRHKLDTLRALREDSPLLEYPLVRNNSATSWEAVCDALDVIHPYDDTRLPPAKSSDVTEEEQDEPDSFRVGNFVLYDAYESGHNVCKSLRLAPDCHLCINTSNDGQWPGLDTILNISHKLNTARTNIPLQLAIVHHGEVSFYMLTDVVLPVESSWLR